MKKIEVYFHPELKRDKERATDFFEMFYRRLKKEGMGISVVTYGPPGDRLLHVGENHAQMILDAFNKTKEFTAEISLTD